MNDLVSFIVPSFNNEQYIVFCLESILKQTHRNIEIIAIDDGSTDDTGLLLDMMSFKHDNIVVIHTQNSGVSAARNLGIAKARGEYLVFVDGDDYLAPDFAQYMLGLIKGHDADFALSKHCFESIKERQIKKDVVKVLSPEETTALLISPTVKVGCWDKIYKKTFLLKNDIVFNEKLFYGEGLFFITTVSQKCRFSVVGERKVYYYRRNNETSACTVFDINKLYNGEKALDLIEKNIVLKNQSIADMICLHRCLFYAGALTKIRINKVKRMYLVDNKRWLKYNRTHLFRIIRSRDISVYRKLLILCSCIIPNFLSILEKRRRRTIQKNSV